MEALNKYLAGKTPKFSDVPWYNVDGDCIFALFKNSNTYDERVDGILTVFRDMESDEVVGCQIKGIKNLLKDAEKLGIFISDKPIFSVLILASYFVTEKDQTAIPDRHTLYGDILQRVGTQRLPIQQLQAIN